MNEKEIKFRAWDTTEQKFVEYPKISEYICRLEYCAGCPFYAFALRESVRYRLAAYTGLHDCNGQEIYEGDIVKATVSYMGVSHDLGAVDENMNLIGHVHSDGLGLRMSIISQSYMEPVFEDGYLINLFGDVVSPDCVEEWLEVIGNIHENPELLQPSIYQ